jgi:hypothetical protein
MRRFDPSVWFVPIVLLGLGLATCAVTTQCAWPRCLQRLLGNRDCSRHDEPRATRRIPLTRECRAPASRNELGSCPSPRRAAPRRTNHFDMVIDPGHGDELAVGHSTALGVRGPGVTLEKDVTLRLAEQLGWRAIALPLPPPDSSRRPSHSDLGMALPRAHDCCASLMSGARIFSCCSRATQTSGCSSGWRRIRAMSRSRERSRGTRAPSVRRTR